MTSLDEVRSFWEQNPLWMGESSSAPGTIPFYEEHRKIYISDCFAGSFDLRFLPAPRPMGQGMKILDLGCGIGFWVSEFAMRGFNHLHAADLTEQALALTAKRLEAFDLKAETYLHFFPARTLPFRLPAALLAGSTSGSAS